ncbi:MAG TPA: ABC transporter substrate-binding protein [Tepidiformaceae bacterium]|nr:ABC transporter substrate-binding protein [Tepidiformaceae bacterium]
MDNNDNYWLRFRDRRIDRRTVLNYGALGGSALATAALIGCGDDDDDAPEPTSSDGAPQPTATPESEEYPANFQDPAGSPKAGGTFRIANDWDVSIVDPIKTAAGGTIVKCNLVYNRLISLNTGISAASDTSLKLVQELSKLPEQPDNLTYTFKIPANVKFQSVAPLNGRLMTAEDIVYAYNRFATAQGSVHTVYFQDVDKMEAVDATTVKITLKTPNPDFVIPLGSRYLTIHPRELVEGNLIETTAVGTGPMILKEMVKGDHVTLLKNPDYWRAKVHLDGMEFRIQPDASSRLAAFRAGQVDFSYGLLGSVRDAENLKGTNKDVTIQSAKPVAGVFALSLNLDNPKFTDERVRQALMLGMDRDTMVEVIYDGYGTVIPTIPWSFLYDKEPGPENFGKWWKYDPAEAKKLLSAAGAENLSFKVIYHEYGASTNTQPLEIMSDTYKQIGVNMEVARVPYTEFNSQWIQRTFEEATDGWQALGFDANNFFYNHIHSTSPSNRWRIKDTQLDQWAVKQRTELDATARKAIHKQIWDRVLDKAYRIEKPSGVGFTAYQPWTRGLRFGGPLLSNTSYYEWGMQIHDTWLDRA